MYSNLNIVQYDRGNLGEFTSLLLYNKLIKNDIDVFECSRNLNGFNFQDFDGSFDALMYDPIRPNIDSVSFQRMLFGSSVYECLLNNEPQRARYIFNQMVCIKNDYPFDSVETIYGLPLRRKTYEYPNKTIVTRIHNFDYFDLKETFDQATIYNIHCRPSKRWIFKFLFFYKKHLDHQQNQLRLSKGLQYYWDYNWEINQSFNDSYINLDCYELFKGNPLIFDQSVVPLLQSNFEQNNQILKQYGLDYRDNFISSNDLLSIVSRFFKLGEHNGSS